MLQFTRHGSCVLFWFSQIIFNICIVQIVFKYRQIQFITCYLEIKKRGTIPHYLTVEGVLGTNYVLQLLPFMGGMEGSHKVVKFDLELLLHFHNEPQVHGSWTN